MYITFFIVTTYSKIQFDLFARLIDLLVNKRLKNHFKFNEKFYFPILYMAFISSPLIPKLAD